MDRNVLHRFFAGTASFEEEEAVCDWVDASDKNREELIRERKYFDVLLLHKAKNSSMPQSGHQEERPAGDVQIAPLGLGKDDAPVRPVR